MAKPRSRWIDFGVYLAVRLGACFIQSLTDRAAIGFGHLMGWLGYALDKRHRRVADDNLRHAFPDLDVAERDRLVRRTYRHFAMLLVDIARLPRKIHRGNWRRFAQLVGCEPMFEAIESQRPTLIITGHFGNWELAGYGLGLLGYRTFAVARRLDNPYLDRLMRRFRELNGQKMLSKNGDALAIAEVLMRGGALATLADQDAGARGMFVDFFGRPASTHKGLAVMARRFDAKIFVVGVAKVGEPLRFRIAVEEVIDPRDFAGADANRAITQRFTSALEQLVRRHPDQYFWLHRRWKHQPMARQLIGAA